MSEQTSSVPAFVDERQEQIREFVTSRGRARIGELVSRFGVTEVTIRKDLKALQERGVLKRTHGGAIARTPLVDREVTGRAALNLEAKRAIAETCTRMVRDGDSIFLDSGTTSDAVAAALLTSPAAAWHNLTILTNAMSVGEKAAEVPRVEHVVLGGQFRPEFRSFVGPMVLRALQQFTVDVAFISVSGLSQAGLTVSSVAEAEVKLAVIDRARRVVVVTDRTKVGATDFARICDLEEVDVLVMDERVPAVEELCADHAVELIVSSEAGEDRSASATGRRPAEGQRDMRNPEERQLMSTSQARTDATG